MEYLFECAIGPVQDFIATARRSRDLWYGSWMLSELSKAAARGLADSYGWKSLVFPAPGKTTDLDPKSSLNVANKVVAIVSDDPAAAGQRVKDAIDACLDELKKDAFAKVNGPFDRTLADRQLADLVEYYWVDVPLTVGYESARNLAESLLAARKTTRDFAQFDGEPIPKSSLDGARESVIPKDAYPRGANDPERDAKIRRLYQRYGARRGERLSGVDLVKRQGMRGELIEQKFRSTSHMAALPFLAMIDREKGAGGGDRLLAEIRSLLKNQGIDPKGEDDDGSLLFESRLKEWIPDDDKLKAMRKVLNEKIQEYTSVRQPDPYYALLLADGDNMGAAIDAKKDEASHRALSEALSEFAFRVGRIVEDNEGVLVYSGGDDVLAYLPLHRVLTCARQLAEDFFDKMKQGDFRTKDGVYPTLSSGIVVAHHLDPLSDALELARQAEKEAKTVPKKNGLAITVSKRSGVDRTIADKSEALHDRLNTMIEFTRKGAISQGTAYELQELDRVLGEAHLPTEAVINEALRIVERKRESGGAKEIAQDVMNQFETWLGAKQGNIPLRRLAQELIVAGVFADALDLAEGPLDHPKEAATS